MYNTFCCVTPGIQESAVLNIALHTLYLTYQQGCDYNFPSTKLRLQLLLRDTAFNQLTSAYFK
jgi:hypothetical protein